MSPTASNPHARNNTGSLLVPVHSCGSERLRLHVHGLYRSEELKASLENALNGRAGVAKASANPLTGNLLLVLVNGTDTSALLDQIENLVRRIAPPSEVEPAKVGRSPRQERPARFSLRKWAGGVKRTDAKARSKAPVATVQVQESPRALFHALAPDESLNRIEVSEDGLSQVEAERRLAVYGANRLAENRRRSPLQVFVEQFANAPMAMLGVSAAVSVATGGIIDAVVIVSAVLLNSVIGYLTESSSERTINALGNMTPTHAVVIRDGRQVEIPVEDVAIGDILLLTPGSYISADARLLSSSRLTVDEAALTGESLPVGKQWDFLCPEETPLADRKNMLHMGTVVTGGSARALVVATGHRTEIGVIQSLVGTVKPPDTLLQRQLDDMSGQLAKVTGALCVVVFGIGILRGYTWLQMLSSSISLAVAAIPEGLPAVATTTLAIGIRNMHREHVLIRHLPAVESLGSVQVICLDKTGTLTLNKMKVTAVRTRGRKVSVSDERFLVDGQAVSVQSCPELLQLLQIVALCSEVKLNGGDADRNLEGSATECALVEASLNAGEDVNALRGQLPVLKVVHRAESRPYMVTVHQCADGRRLYAVKGSPAEVLALCQWIQEASDVKDLDTSARDAVLSQNTKLAGDALRVLGVAYAYADAGGATKTPPLVWLGLIGMEDAVRPGVEALMADFHDAGVRTVMITGDQSATAYSVGRRLGLSGDDPLEIIDSTNLDKLDPEILKGVIKDTSVFARVSPAHKLKIVQALQKAGHVVAMTGDGVNDGPALKAADIGVAMGEQGTDVARSVADVVLEDDNLQTMVAAIRQGRTIYSNIRKSLRFLLSTNLSEIELMFLTMSLGLGEALNPMQLLWINMVADIAPAMALALEPPERDVLKQVPRDPNQAIIDGPDFMRLLRESFVITSGAIGVYGLSLRRYGPGLQASTNTFMTLTLAKIFHAISCRSEETTVLDDGRPANPHMVYALGGTLAIQILAAVVPQLRTLLRSSPLAIADLAFIAAGATVPFLVNESTKRINQERSKNGAVAP